MTLINDLQEGDQKVFCSPSSGLPNPRRLTSATPIRGISRPGAVPSGLFSRPSAQYPQGDSNLYRKNRNL